MTTTKPKTAAEFAQTWWHGDTDIGTPLPVVIQSAMDQARAEATLVERERCAALVKGYGWDSLTDLMHLIRNPPEEK